MATQTVPSALLQSRDDAPFRHYTLKHRVVAWISQNLFDNAVYEVNHGLLKGMMRKGGLGWLPEWITGGDDTPETRFWRSLDVAGKVVYDVGAYHGLISVYLSRTARHVVCYEPTSTNRQRLFENLALNAVRNVTVRPVGLGAAPATAEVVFSPLMTGGATLEPNAARQLVRFRDSRREQIHISTLDYEVLHGGLPAPDFIKIDVEGFELEVLRGAAQTLLINGPALFIEMHGETMNEKRRRATDIVRLLGEMGYRDIRHIESGTRIAGSNASAAAEGHLYCPSPQLARL